MCPMPVLTPFLTFVRSHTSLLFIVIVFISRSTSCSHYGCYYRTHLAVYVLLELLSVQFLLIYPLIPFSPILVSSSSSSSSFYSFIYAFTHFAHSVLCSTCYFFFWFVFILSRRSLKPNAMGTHFTT